MLVPVYHLRISTHVEQGLKTGPYFSQVNYCIISTPSLPQWIPKTEHWRGTEKVSSVKAWVYVCVWVQSQTCTDIAMKSYRRICTYICACRTPTNRYFLPSYTSWNYIAWGEGEPMKNQPTDFFSFLKSAWKLVGMGFPEVLILDLLHLHLMGPIYLLIS